VLRRFVLLVVLAGLFWQGMGVAGRGGLASAGEDVAHALLHWSESAHHHHDDGSYHQDHSDDAVRHVLADDALTAPALCLAPFMNFSAASVPQPAEALAGYLPDPDPDRLRRPPRSTA
jgi:hypothetical protein